MGQFTEDLERFWSVDTLEKAMHDRVTVPKQPEAWADEVQARVVQELFGEFEIDGKDILDFGCGVGRVAKQLAKRGAIVHAVDISQKMLEYCKEFCQGIGELRLYRSDGYNIPVRDKSIDGGFSFYVFQHMPDNEMILAVLNDIHRVLKPGAWFLLQSVDHRSQVVPASVGMHGIRQTTESLGRMAEDQGMRVRSIKEENFQDHRYFMITMISR